MAIQEDGLAVCTAVEATKTCTKCLCDKPVSQFPVKKSCRDGLNTKCKTCCNERHKIYNRTYSKTDRFKARQRAYYDRRGYLMRRKWKYGLTLEQVERLLKNATECDICGNEFGDREPAIDHCHTTNKIRGLLCLKCNAALGYLREDPSLFQRAMDYIKLGGLDPAHRITPGA